MSQQIFRIQPALPVGAMQTYGLVNPRQTHTKPATCQQVECAAYAGGWVTTVDVATDLGAQQANYIRNRSGRSFTWSQAGSMVSFEFPAGQACFASHSVSLERPPVAFKRGGDWRGFASQPRVMRPDDWVDDFATHQQNLADTREKG